MSTLSRITLLLFLLAGALGTRAHAAELLDDRFPSKADAAWKLERRVEALPSITWPPTDDKGLRITSQGLDSLTRESPVGSGPFEFRADVDLTEGTLINFPRFNGFAIVLSSAPVDKMGKDDVAIVYAVLQHGLVAAVSKNGAFGAIERRPGIWHPLFDDASPRFKTTHGGAGGLQNSIPWPNQSLAGMRLRFHAYRDAKNTVKFSVYNADAAAGPWWEAEAAIPKSAENANLKYLMICTTRNPDDHTELARPIVPKDAQIGKTQVSGIVQRVQIRTLTADEKPTLNESFPAAVLPAKPKPAGYKPAVIPSGSTVESLRKKFNAPEFANYKAMLLRNTTPEVMDGCQFATPAQNERLLATLWAYVLTQEAPRRAAMLDEIDALIGPTEKLPQEQYGFPGHLRQQLDIKEFMGHNTAALAIAYDLLGNDLDQPRRDRIRYLLVRSVKNYLDRIERGDWWYINNPSNTIAVGNGTMGMCALALRDDDPELSKQAVDTAVKNIKNAFIAIRPDGSCIEGNMYWNYALSWQLALGHALRTATGSDDGLLTMKGLKNAYRYMETNFGGDDRNVPFNDTQPWLMGWLVCANAGTEFDQPSMRWMADHMAAVYAAEKTYPEQTRGLYAISAFLYRDTKPAPKDFPGMPTLSVLEGVQEGILRSDGKSLLPPLATAVKGMGELSTHHANEDQGSFVLYANGELLLLDPGYFEQKSKLHSLLTIGDSKTMKLNPKAPSPLSDAWESGAIRTLTVDATKAYNTGPNEMSPLATRARRIFVQVGAEALIILDDTLPTDAAAPITTNLQAAADAKIESDGSATVTGAKGTLSIHTFGPEIQLAAAPQKFIKNWVYAKRGVQWNLVSGTYKADPAKPLITVLAPAATGKKPAPATVDYKGDEIRITVGASTVQLKKKDNLWSVVKP